MDLVITVTGVDQVTLSLQSMAAKAVDLSEEMDEIGQELLEFFQNDVYDTEGAALGSPWAALADSTIAQKLKRYGDTPMLVATGLMKASYQLYTAAGWLLIQNEAQNDRGDYYAKYHQDGTTKMPQRLLLDVPDDKMEEIAEKLTTAIVEAGNV